MIIDLDISDYESAYHIQREFISRRKLKEVNDSIILVEHPPIYTIGRTGSIENLLVEKEDLEELGIKVLKVDRGGGITFHGPGQLVAYPIIDLKGKKRDLHLYMRNLEDVAIDFLRDYGVSAYRTLDRTGVWVKGKKICSIGIAATDWVTYHGLSLNVNVDLRYFSMIDVCGLKNVKAISLKKILKKTIDMEEVKVNLLRNLIRVLDLEELSFEKGTILA